MVREFLNILFRKSDLIYGDIQEDAKNPKKHLEMIIT